MSYAGFWKRFVAYLIDTIILGVFVGIVSMIFGVGLLGAMFVAKEAETEPSPEMVAGAMGGIFLFVCIVGAASWLYFALMEASSKQGTVGKMALGIVVTDLNGNRVSFGRATGRFFAKILSGLILYIGYIMAGFTEKKQALHDIIAGCLVVKK